MKLQLIFLTFLFYEANSLKILGVFPLINSHYILGSSLMKGLAEKGHDVTIISPVVEKNPPKNGKYRVILLDEDRAFQNKDQKFNFFDLEDANLIMYTLIMNWMGNDLVEKVLRNPNVQTLLKSNEKFDVVVVEQFCNDALKIFAHYYKAPLVAFVTFGSNAWINPLVANPAPPSYVSEQPIIVNPHRFWDRLKNTLYVIFRSLNSHLLFFPEQNRILHKYFPDAPDLEELNKNISIVLLNSHVSTNVAVPRVPNMIDIGGFHVQPPKQLPKDLQDYLDGAKEGVIYFSMGSNLRSADLPAGKRDAILRAFSKIKQKVLWKWEDDVLPGQPSNVKLSKWLPQQDILAHPNVKAFITHGGLLSLIESVYHGVPVLAIPIFGDQKINAAEAAWGGLGLSVEFSELSEDKFSKALDQILNNPKYAQNMKLRSQIMHDRQVKPIDNADYWINYAVKYKGAPHLRVAGLELPWYEYLSLDVALFVAVLALLGLHVFLVAVRFIFRKLCGKSKVKVH